MQGFFDHLWYKKSAWALLLLPLAALFYLISTQRRKRLLSKPKPPLAAPVVVVGNISVGGTGKTPLLVALVQLLKDQGFKPGVISRGYGGKADYPYALDAISRAEQAGDEPLLIYRRCQCPVVVSPNRLEAAQYLLANYDVDIILSDDGLQHYALPRDIEIIVIDGKRGLGNGFCLPAGPLRETASRLKSVDYVLVNGESEQLFLGQIHHFSVEAETPVAMSEQAANTVLTKNVHALAGIGNPQRFFTTLSQQGYQFEPHVFADHHAFVESDIQFADQKPVLMTEKDAVKCLHFSNLQRHWYLPVSAQLPAAFSQQFLQQIQPYLTKV